MAEVTKVVTDQWHNLGDLMMVENQNVTIAANQDHWQPGLTSIVAAGTNKPGSVTALIEDTTIPPKVLLTTGGAVSAVKVWAIGRP